MRSFKDGFDALIVGASGGIGSALLAELNAMPVCRATMSLSRSETPAFDITSETSVQQAAHRFRDQNRSFDLIINATGALTFGAVGPEKSLSHLNAETMATSFAINTIGPAMLFKYFSPLLSKDSKCVFACLSARVGSIGDNRLGGWYAYRASKAALNQIVKTASIEIARKRPQAVCLALHPGTVESRLSKPYAKGSFTHGPHQAARTLLQTIDHATPHDNGSFLSYDGTAIQW